MKENKIFTVSRDMFLQDVLKKRDYYLARIEGLKRSGRHRSFEYEGCRYRFQRASSLAECLLDGGVPSTHQVTGYFGKGARFEEEKNV